MSTKCTVKGFPNNDRKTKRAVCVCVCVCVRVAFLIEYALKQAWDPAIPTGVA